MNVTVVIPTRNRVDLLRRSVHSILHQESIDVRVVIVDDASTDGTSAWLESVSDVRIVAVRHARPEGVSAARNDGLRRVETEWVAFCDDDDLWAPSKLRLQFRSLEQTPGARWASCGVVFVDPTLEVIGWHQTRGGAVLSQFAVENLIPSGSSVLAEAALVQDAGGFDELLTCSEDWDLWIRLAQRSPLAVANGPLVAYRIGVGSASSDVERMRHGFDTVASRYRHLAGDALPDRFAFDRYLAKQQLRAGMRIDAARAYLDLAVEHRRPSSLLRAASALVSPSVMDRVGSARARRSVPPAWLAMAEDWLLPLRAAASPTDSEMSSPRTHAPTD